MFEVGFSSWHLFKHVGKFDNLLAQVMNVYSMADDSTPWR